MFSGGSSVTLTVRWPLMRTICDGPTVCFRLVRSPTVCTPAAGVMTGSSASSSGERHSCDLTMMSSRSSPSKYSPAHRPPVIARIAAATSVRVSPERAMRHSSGTSCNSGWLSSSPGNACG